MSYELNECEGPLCYKHHGGIFYLDNPITLMYASMKGLPVCAHHWEDIGDIVTFQGIDAIVDDGEDGEYYDAAVKVLACLK